MAKLEIKSKSSIFERLVPALLVISIGLSFMVGVLWQKVENLSKGSATNTTTTTTQQQATKPTVSKDQIKALFDKGLMTFGNKDSKLTFVEFSDPSCPYCHVAGGKNAELNKKIGPQFTLVSDGGKYVSPVVEMKKLVDSGKASFVWGYFNGHGNGEMGTKAFYCAYDKGKFWEVHDLLMSAKGYDLLNNTVKNDVANAGKLADFLKPAGVDGLLDCLKSDKYNQRLQNEMNIGLELGVSGTPGFYVNETNFAGAYSFTDMKSAVDSALK